METKIVLKKQRKHANDNMYRVRVSGEAFESLESLSERTNMSMSELASKLLLFAMDYVVVEGEET